MTFNRQQVQAFLRSNLAGLLIVVLMAPWAAAVSFPRRAEAQLSSSACLSAALLGSRSSIISGAIGGAIGAVPVRTITADPGIYQTSGNTTSITIHDCVIKPLVILIAKTLLAQLTRSIVNWINNGFNGNPAFITDLRGFLTNVADQVIGDFVYGSELSFLCSPFQLQVRIALALNYQPFQNRARCTLSGIVKNTQSAFTNFAAGGWPAWFSLTTNPANNPYGAYLLSQSELSARVGNTTINKQRELDWGRGFLSFKECNDRQDSSKIYYSYDPLNQDDNRNCVTVTPGAAIEGSLQNVLGSEIDQLELANDINSIIGALVGQLTKQGLLALGGIRGLSTPSAQFGGGTALDFYVANAQDAAVQGRIDAGVTLTNAAIARAQQYVGIKQQTLSRVLDAESDLKSVIDCYQGKIASSSLSSTDLDTANQRIIQASTTIRSLVTPKKQALSAQIAQTQAAIDQAYQLLSQIQSATTQAELDSASSQYTSLTSSGALPSDLDVQTATQEQQDILAEIDPLIQDTQNKLNACYAFPPQQTI